MNLPYKNNPSGQCAIYAIANIFDRGDLVRKFPPKPKKGYDFLDLCKVFESQLIGICIETIWKDARPKGFNLNSKIFREMFNDVSLNKDQYLPFLLFTRGRNKPHAISILYDQFNGGIIELDSAKKRPGIYTLNEFFGLHDVFELIRFRSPQGGLLAIERDDLKHIFDYSKIQAIGLNGYSHLHA